MISVESAFCVILFLKSTSNGQSTETRHGRLHDDILLRCNMSYNYVNSRWRKNNEIIAHGSLTTNSPRWKGRLNILLDDRTYNLHISNLKKEDAGSYWCEIQDDNNTTYHDIYLHIKEEKTKPTKSVGTSISPSKSSIEHTTEQSTNDVTELSSSMSSQPTLKTTLKTNDHDKRYIFQDEMYIIIAVGFVALIAVSIGCKVVIYKCQKRPEQIYRRQAERNDTIDNTNNLETVDYPHYEVVDESDLINAENVGEVVQLGDLPTHPVLSASYLEVIQPETSNSSTSSADKGSRFTLSDSVKMSLSGYLLAYKSVPNANTQYHSLTLLREQSLIDSGVNLKTNESKHNSQKKNKDLSVEEVLARRHSCP